MNLDIVRPKNETEDLLLPVNKKCETLIKQTHKNHKKHLILNLLNQEKLFLSNH